MTLIFLCGIYTGNSQDIFHKADSLFSAGHFQLSGLEYEWLIYSSSDRATEARAVLGRVQSYKQLGLYELALDYIDKANMFGLPDSTSANIIYESLLINYLSESYPEIQSRYLMGRQVLKTSRFDKTAKLLLCLGYLKSGDWDKVTESARSFLIADVNTDSGDSLISVFEGLYEPGNIPRMKNPNTARILSMIIPGSGQIYSGYIGDGFLNFGLHLAALGGAGIAFSQGLFITGWLGGFGLLQKLYFGGVKRAEELAKQRNRLNKEKFIQPVSKFLLDISRMPD